MGKTKQNIGLDLEAEGTSVPVLALQLLAVGS